jgi:hypothetical protein
MDHNLPSATNSESVSFAEDPRAFFNKATGTWRLEDDDGSEFEYDQAKGIWVPLVSTHSSPLSPLPLPHLLFPLGFAFLFCLRSE